MGRGCVWVLLLLGIGWLEASGAEVGTKPLVRDFMGINGHTVLFKPELYRPVAGLVRDYHPAEWDLGKDSDFTPPFPFARNRVDWSKVYGSWKAAGWRTDVSLMFETLPREQWKDLAKDSRLYAERFARAFGPSSTNALVESVEVGNEPGKFNDADYRVVFENMARGLKAGDPKIRVVTGALTTGKSHDYAKSVSSIAGLEPLYDVLNVHSYAQLEGWPTWKRSFPEDPALKEYLPDIRSLCAWRDANAPGKEVWLTEFGYDSSTRPPDPKTEFRKWAGVTDERQAQWNVRSWLVFAALPVQRAYVFYSDDDDAPHVHGSAGLTRKLAPKPSFHAAAHLQKTLGDFRFSKVLIDRPSDAMLYEFSHGTDPAKRIWVAWSPTGSSRKARLQLPPYAGRIIRAERMPLSRDEPAGVAVEPMAKEIEIGESPVYLRLENGTR